MQGFSYTIAGLVIGLVLLGVALSIAASPLFAMVIVVVAIVAFLLTRGARSAKRTQRAGQSPVPSTEEAAYAGPELVTPASRDGVAERTPDPEVDRRSAESFPASDPPASY
jgi:hypothetical protein